MAMTRKQMSKIICGNLMRNFDWLQSQETTLVAVVMDSLKEIESIEKGVVPRPALLGGVQLEHESKNEIEM